MNARLSKEELNYWTARIGGPRPSERIEYAHVLAMEFVTEHARDMLPCIQHGVLSHYFRCLIEHDIGELDRPEFCRHSVAALRVAPFKLYR